MAMRRPYIFKVDLQRQCLMTTFLSLQEPYWPHFNVCVRRLFQYIVRWHVRSDVPLKAPVLMQVVVEFWRAVQLPAMGRPCVCAGRIEAIPRRGLCEVPVVALFWSMAAKNSRQK